MHIADGPEGLGEQGASKAKVDPTASHYTRAFRKFYKNFAISY